MNSEYEQELGAMTPNTQEHTMPDHGSFEASSSFNHSQMLLFDKGSFDPHSHHSAVSSLQLRAQVLPLPLLSLDEALSRGSGEKSFIYSHILFRLNIASAIAFSGMALPIFLFSEPKVECYSRDLDSSFRCTLEVACAEGNNLDHKFLERGNVHNFITYFGLECSGSYTVSFLVGITLAAVVAGMMGLGVLSNRYGRRNVSMGLLIVSAAASSVLVAFKFVNLSFPVAVALLFLAILGSTA